MLQRTLLVVNLSILNEIGIQLWLSEELLAPISGYRVELALNYI